MSSLRGFRCRRCRAEVLARSPEIRSGNPDAEGCLPPVLCCGQSLRPFPTDQLVSATLRRPRHTCCALCGYSLQIVVHPDGPLVCEVCRRELAVPTGKNSGPVRTGSVAVLCGNDVAPPAPVA